MSYQCQEFNIKTGKMVKQRELKYEKFEVLLQDIF